MALSADRATPSRDAKKFSYPMLTGVKIYAGSIVVLDSSGYAKPGVAATGLVCVGAATETVDNTDGGSGDVNIEVESGCFRWENGETITKAAIGDTAYIYDDQTVYTTGSSKSQAGRIVDVDADGVWVDTAPGTELATTGLLAANNLSDIGSASTARANLLLTDSSADLDLDTVTYRNKLTAGGSAYTVGSAADGDTVIQTSTDNAVITLPDISASVAGKRITVQNTGADGAAKVSISPHSSDKIKGGVYGDTAGALVSFSGTANKDAINTKATSKAGDYLVLVADATDTWWVIGGKGIWASES